MTPLTVVLMTAFAHAPPPASDLPALATGRFLLAETPAEYGPRLDAAVDEAIASLNFLIRPLAGLRLRPAVDATVCPDLRLTLVGEVFTVQCAGGEVELRYLDGRDQSYLDGSDPYRIRVTREGRSIAVVHTGERGGQAKRYTFTEDGALRLEGTIFSSSLPAPLRWTLPYRRASSGP
ncbi:MAG: hypothetical protein ABIO70_18505 [Pseudomonadota bacterium]